jgi:8-oxo-dGDP phosphatase
MYSMPESWADREIRRMIGPDITEPLATTHRHVAWENPALRLECNLVRYLATSQDAFAVRITPAVDPYYSAVVIPLAPDGRLHLVGRYRYAIDRWSIEFPRFDFDSSDAGWKDAAQSDLSRATGLIAKRMNLLGAIQIDPALLSTSAVVILAQGCTRPRAKPKSNAAEGAQGDTPEILSGAEELIAGSLALPLAELSELVERGEIVCGVTLAALSLYRARLR